MRIIPLLICSVLIGPFTFAQTDLSIENQAPILHEPTAISTPVSGAKDLTEECLPQSAGRFWSIADGLIMEWAISGNTITQGSAVLQGTEDMNSLAFCRASGVTTFYCDADLGGITYYDDDQWVVVPLSQSIYNHGGSGEHLYFVDLSNDLYHFSGTTATMIASPEPGSFRADIVVRENGNVIVLYGLSGIGQPATAFREYSPDGTLVQSYTTGFDPDHSWGAFLLNNTVYLAFGETNTQYAHHLVPFTLSGTSAQIGTPIFFPQGDMFDLASCTQNVSIGLNEVGQEQSTVLMTLAGAGLNLHRIDGRGLGQIQVFDARGRSIFARSFSTSQTTIAVDGWGSGIYLIHHGEGVEWVVKP